jgi:hypothetical protein
MSNVVLHIGAAKCGSTALQKALSDCPVFSNHSGRSVAYVAILKDGRVLTGHDIAIEIARKPSGSTSSAVVGRLIGFTSSIRAEIDRLRSRYDVLVLSCEGWLSRHERFRQLDMIQKLGLAGRAIAYIRPQVVWMNSGWWQWGAWEGMTLEDWIAKRMSSTRWSRMIYAWRTLPGVEEVTVRLLPSDVVPDFFALINCDPPAHAERANTSSSASVLRMCQRHPHLRPLGKPGINYALSRHVQGSTPWVISREMAEHIIAETREDNVALKAMLDSESAAAMEADPRWWSADAFADKLVETAGVLAPDAIESDKLAAALAKELLQTSRELWRLRHALETASTSEVRPGAAGASRRAQRSHRH